MLCHLPYHTKMNKIRNNDIHREAEVVSVEETLRERRLRSSGHVLNRPKVAPFVKVMQFQ